MKKEICTKEICTKCHWGYDPKEFNPCEIRSIMEEQHLCFKCAFWKWQKRLDVEVRPKEGIIPIITQKYYKNVVQVNTQTHYCLTLGPNNLISRARVDSGNGIQDLFKHITTGILTTDGYLYPYTGYSKDGGLSHQGDIPVNNHDFQTNAKFIQVEELHELINSVYVKLELLEDSHPGVFRVKVPHWIAIRTLISDISDSYVE